MKRSTCSMETLEFLKTRLEYYRAERIAISNEIDELHKEYKELTYFLQSAPKGTPAADLLASQRDLGAVLEQARKLQNEYADTCRLEQQAELAHGEAARAVESARKALERCTD